MIGGSPGERAAVGFHRGGPDADDALHGLGDLVHEGADRGSLCRQPRVDAGPRTNSTSAFGGGQASLVSSASFAPGYAHGIENDLAVLTLRTPTTAPAIQLGERGGGRRLRAARRRPLGRRLRKSEPA